MADYTDQQAELDVAAEKAAARKILGLEPEVAAPVYTDQQATADVANEQAAAGPLGNVVPDFRTMDNPIQATPAALAQPTDPAFGTFVPPRVPSPAEMATVGNAPPVVEPAAAVAATPAPVAPKIEPTPEQHAEAHATIVEPVQKQIAAQRAEQTAQQDIAAEQLRIADELAQRREAAVKGAADTVNEVRSRSLPEIMQRGSFGEKLGASIALLVGGISQGLTGAKTNPVSDFIDAQVERQDRKDKLSAENKIALRKAFTDEAIARLQALEGASQDQYRKGQLGVARSQLLLDSQKAQTELIGKWEEKLSKQDSASIQADAFAGKEIKTPSALPKEMHEGIVHTPDGKMYYINPKDKSQFETARAAIEPAIVDLKSALNLSKDFNRVTDLTQRAIIQQDLQVAIGKLRMPIFGPGVLTPTERKLLEGVMGNPTAFVALPTIERAKLDHIIKKLDVELDRTYEQVGLQRPKTTGQRDHENIVKSLKAKGYTQAQIDKSFGNVTGQ